MEIIQRIVRVKTSLLECYVNPQGGEKAEYSDDIVFLVGGIC